MAPTKSKNKSIHSAASLMVSGDYPKFIVTILKYQILRYAMLVDMKAFLQLRKKRSIKIPCFEYYSA